MNAERLTQFVDQIQKLWETHVPPEYQVSVLPVAGGMLLAGILLSVFGAKLARAAIICGLGVLGVVLAVALAPHLGGPTLTITIVGALVGAGIGWVLFRLWVGLAAGAFLGVLALSVYGSQAVVPRFLEYAPPTQFNGTFTLPDPSSDDTAEDTLSGIEAWAKDFWLYVQSRETDVNSKVVGIGLGAALLGLLVGCFLPRLTLIVVSGVVGTLLVMSGLAGVAAHYQVDLTQTAGQHSRVVAVAGVVFLFGSLLFQALLTRKAPPRPKPQPYE